MSSTTIHSSRRSRLISAAGAVRANVAPDARAWLALAVAMAGTAGLLLYLTRGTTFWFDEWLWIVQRRGSSLATFLNTYDGHLSLVPIAIYKLLFATVGIGHYLPYRIVVTAGQLVVAGLIYVYVRLRLGGFLALLTAAAMLLFGPGWQEFIWPFQIAWLVAIAAGIAALMMLDRRDRRGDLAACGLITLSVASTSVGVAIALGMIVEIWGARRRLRDAWIVAIPLCLYVLWTLGYQHAIIAGDLSSAVGFAAQSAVIGIPALLGLSGTSALNSTGTLLAFGAPLTVAAAAVVLWLGRRRATFTPRVLTLLAILIAFWLLAGLGRSDLQGPYTGRYLYVDAAFTVLLAAEFARGIHLRWNAQLGLALITAVAVVSNIGVLRSGAGFLRASATGTNAELGALNLSRTFATRDYIATSFPGYPFLRLRAVDLFAAERALGTIGDSASQLAAAPEPAREIADREMTGIQGLTLAPQSQPPQLGAAPRIDSVVAGAVVSRGSCTSFAASAAASGQSNQLALTIPPGGVWLTASGAEAAVAIRRFALAFEPLGSLPAATGGLLRIPDDGVASPWHLQVTSTGRVRVCGLAG